MSITKNVLSQSGATLITTMVATSIIGLGIFAVGSLSASLRNTLRRTEAVDLAIATEGLLVKSFNDKANFPDAVANDALRGGTTDILPLTAGALGAFNVPVTSDPPPADYTGFIGFVGKDNAGNIVRCIAFAVGCPVRFQVRLMRRAAGGGLFRYGFSYQIDVDPNLVNMSPIGDILSYESSIDPGMYRAEQLRTKCDPTTDLFATGFNRDTGESFCAEKPTVFNASCPEGHLAKGIKFIKYTGGQKAGTVQMDCTAAPMRKFRCPDNYALESFNPSFADPEATPGTPGECIFRTKTDSALPVTYPAAPEPVPSEKIYGTFCPPYYTAENLGCVLQPDTERNSSYTYGLGRCGTSAEKDCRRSLSVDFKIDNSDARDAWDSDLRPVCADGITIPCKNPPRPPSTYWRTSYCSDSEFSPACNGVATRPSNCYCGGISEPRDTISCRDEATSWAGTLYATDIHDVTPTASVVKSSSGRTFSCSFTDTSRPCTAPATDIDGRPYGKHDPKWYGGVKVSGGSCTLDVGQVNQGEHVHATLGD